MTSSRDDSGDEQIRFQQALLQGPQQPSELPPQEPLPRPGSDVITRAEGSGGDDEEEVEGVEGPWSLFESDAWRKLPLGMAELIVTPTGPLLDGSPRFRLKVHCCCCKAKDLGVEYGRPDLDLGRHIRPGGLLATEFLYAMRDWSHYRHELAGWLHRRRLWHEDKLELVIWDDTPYRIPWELFWQPAKRGSGLSRGYLGAVVTVTRWVTMGPYWPENVKRFNNTDPYQARGPVAAFIAGEMDEDRGLLRGIAVHSADSMQQLFAILAGDPEALAMVYVACHGDFDDDPRRCVLGGYRLVDFQMLDDDLPWLESQPALVFLNGCHTGELGLDLGQYNDGALRGFAVEFLRSGASGVLATTGAVGTVEARQLAGNLINDIRTPPDVHVPDALRMLRAEAGAKLTELLPKAPPADDSTAADDVIALHKELLPHLFPFMYVYYGSPRMLVSLTSADVPAGTGD